MRGVPFQRDKLTKHLTLGTLYRRAKEKDTTRQSFPGKDNTTYDVYGVHPHIGRGGWTWYIGSAGWMYRVALNRYLVLQDHTFITTNYNLAELVALLMSPL